MKHLGNLDIYGLLSVSQNTSKGYTLPEEVGENGTVIGVINKDTGQLGFIEVFNPPGHGGPPGQDKSDVESGQIICETNKRLYDIKFKNKFKNPIPVVSLVIPNEMSDIFVQGVYDISDKGFKVALSNVPDFNGYKINWIVKEL